MRDKFDRRAFRESGWRRRTPRFGQPALNIAFSPPIPPSGWSNSFSTFFNGLDELLSGSVPMTGSQAETGLPIGATGSFAWSLWIYGSGTAPSSWLGGSGNETLFTIGNQGAGVGSRFLQQSFKTRDSVPGTFEWTFYETSPDGTSTTARFSAPDVFVWNHIILSLNGAGATNADKIRIYINGAEQSPTFVGTLPGALLTSSLPLVLASAGTSRFGAFAIDELCLYNTNLTQSHATALYNGGTPVDPTSITGSSNLAHYWRFGDETDADPTIYDRTILAGITPINFTMINMDASNITASVAPAGTISWP
ncbi:MAG: LamG domain-containing protein [Anaerolineales bacterium]|nr:LamG domain-containing protein [Anaerolineales bacterium]